MECYEGATMIKTFRGLIADGAQDTIVLHTNDGSTGYTIKSLQIIGFNMNEDCEHILSIFKVKQTTLTTNYDFSDPTLLAAAFLRIGKTAPGQNVATIIFDKEIFNQDIYVTHEDVGGSAVACNYYLELEQVKLDLNANTVATLKNLKNLEPGS